MARKAKDAGKLADEMIAAQSKAEDEPVVEPNLQDEPIADPEPEDEFDLSKLDGEDEPEPEPVHKEKDWEHMYSVLQGKYNAETERLSTMLSQAMQRISALEAQGIKPKSDSPEIPTDEDDLVKLQEEYPSLYKGFMALVRREAAAMNKVTEAKVDGVIHQTAANRRDTYFDQLSRAVPKWEAINNHPVFLKWLAVPDRYTGTTRYALLNNAFNHYDVETTKKFFLDFMKEKGIKTQNANTDTEEIAPNTSGANVTRQSEKSGWITNAEINKFYSDRARGKFAGSEEDAKKFEAKIMQAVKDGKIKK